MFKYTALLAMLPGLGLGQGTCGQAPTNFLIYSNSTGNYGSLGHPCRSGPCGLFFSATEANIDTYYNLTKSGRLVVSGSGQPSNPIGVIAYGAEFEGSIEFGSKRHIQATKSFKPLSCTIELSSDADGSCDLMCALMRGNQSSVGQSYNPRNYYQAFLGNGGSAPFQIKVDFNTTQFA